VAASTQNQAFNAILFFNDQRDRSSPCGTGGASASRVKVCRRHAP
jgi:hypothetical protein